MEGGQKEKEESLSHMQAGGSTIGWIKDNKYGMKHKAADREGGLRGHPKQ